MNRSIALFVALLILFAHILAIHSDGEGNFAFPYDRAYVVFRLVQNLVREGELAWILGLGGNETYPSPLWIAIAAVGERLAYPVFLFCQATGVLATLASIIFCAQFHTERTASLIAPLLLAASGCIAAGAANGLETGLFLLTVTASFWCFERGYALRLAIAVTLCCLTRPEGCVFVGGLLGLRLTAKGAGPRALWPFLVPAAVLAVALLVRPRAVGALLAPAWFTLVDPAPGQIGDGLEYLLDFLRASVSPLLLVYPLYQLVRRQLSPIGARALVLAALWTAFVVVSGRAPLPFAEALVPALPFYFLAIQEGLMRVLDAPSPVNRRLAIGALVVGIGGSGLASKVPGDIGPIGLGRWHLRWMESSGSARFGYEQRLGRLGLEEEIAMTNRLRAVGLFLRDHVAPIDPTYSVLSPWPASMAYLSRMHVWDMLGRTNPIPGRSHPASWSRRERADVVAVVRQEPAFDYIVPLLEPIQRTPTIEEIARAWQEDLDVGPPGPERLAAIASALSDYELIDVPIYGFSRGPVQPKVQRIFLLRHRQLGLRPQLQVTATRPWLRVDVRHKGHQQLVDLSVQARDERGRIWYLRPNGELAATPARARTFILLYNTGERAVELYRGQLPHEVDGARLVEICAGLRNPGCDEEHSFAATSDVICKR